jgi:hypothetical protein
MTAIDIADSALVTFRFTQDLDAELYQWGFKTTRRDVGQINALLTAAQATWASDFQPFQGSSHLTAMVYSEWDTIGFTGYHQRQMNLASSGGGSASRLPPQCSVVISLLNTDTLHPIRSRRGRIFFGTLAQNCLASDGSLAATARTALRTAMDNLGTAVGSIPVATTAPGDIPGIGIGSVKTGLLLKANVCGIGHAIDTQRRRRQKLGEAIDYTTLL